jgi:hypothetical protein
MSKIYNEKLLTRLASKLDKSPKYIREQISKRAGSLGVLPETYFVLWLMENRISASKYVKNLEAGTRAEIQQNKSLFIGDKIKRSPAQQSLSTTKNIVRKSPSSYKPISFLLSHSDIDGSDRNAEHYKYLYLMENSTRAFITYFLEKEYGANWWIHSKGNRAVVKRTIKDNVKDRRKKESENPINQPRGAHPLHYTDFDDLAMIVEDNRSVFDPVCAVLAGSSVFVSQILRRQAATRNSIAHMGNVGKTDSQRLRLDWRDIHAAYKNIGERVIDKK